MTEFLRGTVIAALEKAGKPLKSKELARQLDVPSEEYREFRDYLRRLVSTGELYRVKHGRYAPPGSINLVPGVISVLRRRGAFLIPEKGGDDVYVRSDDLGNAYHGDRAVVRIEHRRGGKPEGRVVRVLERAREQFIGTLSRSEHFAYVSPDDPRFKRDVLVPLDEVGEAADGEKVMVSIMDWGSTTAGPVGRIADRLGMPGDPGLDVLMIIKSNNLPEEFPEAVEAAARSIPETISADEIEGRLDLRGVDVVTIDPPTARDFDDALSLTEEDEGNFELGVHIADVSHYVRFDDDIDREALHRGTSVYLVDRVLPMLPEKLSNNLCSLNPGVDRLAMSVMVKITPKGKVLGYRIEDTVIRSKQRLAYEQVQAVFDGDSKMRRELDPVLGLLERLRSLAAALNGKRVKRGALDFDLPSSRVLLDDEGLPTDIQKVVRTESNRLVEEFMLLANEIVARHLKKQRKPGAYRVHEEPKEEKLQDLQDAIGRFGHVLKAGKDGSVPPKELQRVLAQSAGTPGEMIVNTLVLRSLMRARYDIHPLGHFGLALRDYTHFTSPIRRYPDLLVHRILRMQSGRQKRSFRDEARFTEWLDDACLRSSERERLAESAERDSIELKKIQFMERHIGDEFDGVISGVEAFGFFVELETYHVSGLVHINNLEDDYYEYLEDEVALMGSNHGRKFTLGDRIRVQVLAVKHQLRQIDFLLISDGGREETALPEGKRRKQARSDFEGRRAARGSRPKKKKVEEKPVRRKKSGESKRGEKRKRGGRRRR